MEQALENHVVLSTIFNNCDVKDLRVIRRVSKSWLRESLPIWRKKTVIRIRINGFAGEFTITPRALAGVEEDYYKNVEEWEDSSPRPAHRCKIFTIRRAASHFEAYEKSDFVTLDEFLDYVEEDLGRRSAGPETAPFQNFKIEFERTSCWQEDAAADGDILTPRFWEVCGPHMKQLEVRGYLQPHCVRLRDILLGPMITPRLEAIVLESRDAYRDDKALFGIPLNLSSYTPKKPTVKSFKFVWNGFLRTGSTVLHNKALKEGDVDNSRTQLPFTWQEMFTCFNNLERLSISLDLENPLLQETLLAPLQTLKQFKSQGGLGKLEHLSYGRGCCHSRVEDKIVVKQVLKILGETKISLRSLSLGWYPWDVRSVPEMGYYYYQLLEKQKGSLETFDVEKLTTPNVGVFPPGVIFPNLTTLLIDQKAFGGMEFFNNAPKLKAIRVSGDNELPASLKERDFVCLDKLSDDIKDSAKDDVLPICENMKELICKKVCTLKEILRMTKQMPNLEVLELPMENSALQLVCQKWTKLRRLTILKHPLGGVTEAGVVGCWDSPWPSSVPPVGIGNLKELCHVEWALPRARYDDHYNSSSSFLTFVSVSQGIFQLPRLRYLKLNAQLSKRQKEELFRRVPCCVLYYKHMATGKWKIVTNIWRDEYDMSSSVAD